MSRRILLADDSVTIQKVIELTFMDDDFEVKAVGNGDEAIAFLASNPVDFVISDVHMPGANGYEVCRRAKELRPGIPVLLLVGTFEPFDEHQARASGANSFLKKPFDSQELLQRVHELLGPAPAAETASAETAGAPAAAAGAAEVHAAAAVAVEPPPSLLGFTAAPEPAAAEPAAAPEWHGFELEAEPEEAVHEAHAHEAHGQAGAVLDDERQVHEAHAHEAHAHAETAAPTGPMAATAPMPSWSQPAPPAPAMPAEARPFTLADEPAAPTVVPRPEPLGQPFSLDEPLDERDFRLSPHEQLAPPAPARFEIEPEQRPFSLQEAEGPAAPTFTPPTDATGSGGGAAEHAPRPVGFPSWSPTMEERAGAPQEAAPAAAPAATAASGAGAASGADVGGGGGQAGIELAEHAAAGAAEHAFAVPAAEHAAAVPAAGNGVLSEEDVDRIARRVVELIGDKVVRDVAWEVIPDLAEVVIKDRLRELEGQIE